MNKDSTIEMQNGIIKMLLDKIAVLEAEITHVRNLSDDAQNDDETEQRLRDEVARINHMLFGDEYTWKSLISYIKNH